MTAGESAIAYRRTKRENRSADFADWNDSEPPAMQSGSVYYRVTEPARAVQEADLGVTKNGPVTAHSIRGALSVTSEGGSISVDTAGSADPLAQAAAIQKAVASALLEEDHEIFLIAAGICVLGATIALISLGGGGKRHGAVAAHVVGRPGEATA